MRKKLMGVLLVVILVGSFVFPAMANAATNPTVTITVKAKVISATNTESDWNIGMVGVDNVKYFSGDNLENDTYSQLNNTGNVEIDVALGGSDFEGGDYDWLLNTTADTEKYSLYANSEATPTTYDVEVKTSDCNNLATDLAAGHVYNWSMKFTAPSGFNAADPGTNKTATLTLVVTEHT